MISERGATSSQLQRLATFARASLESSLSARMPTSDFSFIIRLGPPDRPAISRRARVANDAGALTFAFAWPTSPSLQTQQPEAHHRLPQALESERANGLGFD